MDSNMGRRPKIGGAAPGRFCKSVLFQWLRPTPILVYHETGGIGKIISLSFQAYIDHPNRRSDTSCTSIWRQDGLGLRVGLEVYSWIPNWLGLPPCCACFLGSPPPSWCPAYFLWSTPWFLITIKSWGSNLFSRSLADEHKNEFTWRRNCCARDLIIGPYISIEGMAVSNVVMSSSASNSLTVSSNLP
jgi:hypothetical protein